MPSSTIIPSNDPSNYRNSSSSGVIIAIAITVSILVVIVSGLLVFLKLNAKRRSNIYKYAISFQNKLMNEKEKQSVTDTEEFQVCQACTIFLHHCTLLFDYLIY